MVHESWNNGGKELRRIASLEKNASTFHKTRLTLYVSIGSRELGYAEDSTMPSRPLHGIASTATPLAKNGQRFPQNGQRFFKTTERFFLCEALSRTESIDTSKKTVRLSVKL